MRILLIEDDEILADRLAASLSQHQHVVDAIATGPDGLEYAQATAYDLIISDVGLPGLDGITLCHRLRQGGCTTPILLMTAKDAPDERVRGLDAGADDHLTKPLDLEELHARIRALGRRGEVAPETVLQAGPLRLDPVSCQVTYGSAPVKLTPKEYSLLELFLRSPNRVFSRAHLVEHLWSFEDPPLEDSVKAHIKGLRRKLKQAGADNWIDNVYGIGYRFVPQAPAPEPAPAAAPVEAAFQTSMATLWEKYQGLMAQRLESLNRAAAAIKTGDLTPELRQAAAQAAHKLAGILGMFDRDEGTDLARGLEAQLEAPEAELAAVPAQIAQLVALVQAPAAPAAATAGGLFISPDTALGAELQALAEAAAVPWRQVSLEAAEAALAHSPPDWAVLDMAAAALWAPSLALAQRLAAHSPPVPTLVLTASDSLIDRVALAQAGVQRLLPRPVTAPQVWQVATQLHTPVPTAQILVVDDDPLVPKALRPLLEPWGLGITGLEAPAQFWAVLAATRPDLLILDVEMPEFTGIELCQAVRTDPAWQNLPILFLTARRDAATVQQMFRAGADDYVAKPIVGPELLTRILNRLERSRLLHRLTHRDALTGLAGYRHSKQALTQLLERHPQASLTLVCLDDLRTLTRRHGHDGIHRILRTWGQCMQTLGRPETTGYWGGGEFVVGLPGSDQEPLTPLLQTLGRQIVVLPAGERIQPEFTWASATYPEDGHTLQALYQAAAARLEK